MISLLPVGRRQVATAPTTTYGGHWRQPDRHTGCNCPLARQPRRQSRHFRLGIRPTYPPRSRRRAAWIMDARVTVGSTFVRAHLLAGGRLAPAALDQRRSGLDRTDSRRCQPFWATPRRSMESLRPRLPPPREGARNQSRRSGGSIPVTSVRFVGLSPA